MTIPVIRTIACYSRTTEKLVSEVALAHVPIESIRELFEVGNDLLMYDSYPVTPEQLDALRAFITSPEKLITDDPDISYSIECESAIEYTTITAIDSILSRLGIDPKTRYDAFDQDHEYTTCVMEELAQYLDLYGLPETTDHEKRVLGCYFLDCLNTQVTSECLNTEELDQALSIMFHDIHIHSLELKYWTHPYDPEPDNWWPIKKHIDQWVAEKFPEGTN